MLSASHFLGNFEVGFTSFTTTHRLCIVPFEPCPYHMTRISDSLYIHSLGILITCSHQYQYLCFDHEKLCSYFAHQDSLRNIACYFPYRQPPTTSIRKIIRKRGFLRIKKLKDHLSHADAERMEKTPSLFLMHHPEHVHSTLLTLVLQK